MLETVDLSGILLGGYTAMKKLTLFLSLTSALLALCLIALPAYAQATRTWVSGVGDDANPCSRTAPCKTFAGAISKTAVKGEINCLDPGGFGAVTITKSITISCEIGTAGVLVSGTNGIVVSVLASDIVYLRGLDIQGITTGLAGITFIQAGVLHVEHCLIRGFNAGTAAGINFAPTGASELYVTDLHHRQWQRRQRRRHPHPADRRGQRQCRAEPDSCREQCPGVKVDSTGGTSAVNLNFIDSVSAGNTNFNVGALPLRVRETPM